MISCEKRASLLRQRCLKKVLYDRPLKLLLTLGRNGGTDEEGRVQLSNPR
jgi:hypothetical protein